jgi:hypothetical protein
MSLDHAIFLKACPAFHVKSPRCLHIGKQVLFLKDMLAKQSAASGYLLSPNLRPVTSLPLPGKYLPRDVERADVQGNMCRING